MILRGGIMLVRKKFLVLISFLVFCALILPGIVAAAGPDIIFVNTTGNDDNLGTQESPKLTILNATGAVAPGGGIYITNGIYKGDGNRNITISKNVTIFGESRTDTIIDGEGLDRIFNITSDGAVILANLTIQNGYTEGNGGAVYNDGFLGVFNTNFTGNSANSYGGAIFNNGIYLIVSNSTFTGNSVNWYGGAICNYGGMLGVDNSTFTENIAYTAGGGIANYATAYIANSILINNTASTAAGALYNDGMDMDDELNLMIVENSTFTGNSGDMGGAIMNEAGYLIALSSTFTGNSANSGGAIFSAGNGTVVVNFNIFLGNNASDSSQGSAIYSVHSINAENNWWGFNGNPSDLVNSNVDVTPWLFLKISANPVRISKNVKSTITADLTYDSNGGYHNPADGHIPDNIPITFTTNLGNLGSTTITKYTLNGVAKATLTGGTTDGTANISAELNDQTVQTNVIIDNTPPTVTSSNPTKNATNVAADKVIKITFNKNIKMGTGWVELKKGSTVIKTTNSVSGKVLTIKPSSSLIVGVYTVIIHTSSVTSDAGAPVSLFNTKFTVVTPSKVTISQIAAAAASVKSYFDKNKRLPSTVTISGIKVSMPKFLYLLSQATIQISSGKTASITIKNVNAAPKESGQIKSGKILKADFITIAKNVVNFINNYGRAPNYLTTKLGNMKFTKVIYMFSAVLSFYKTNKRLPNYVTMSK